ncbi:MAG: hypothetical protein WKG52_00970 [Variovorax sp.]
MNWAIENVVQTESGPRFVQTGTYNGVGIEIVTAYDATYDMWPFHVYVVRDYGRERVTEKPTTLMHANMNGAFEQGMQIAVQRLTPKPDGAFQTAVKS